MKKLMSALLFFCLLCVPLSAWAGPLPPESRDYHRNHHREHRIVVNTNQGGEVNPDGVITVRDGKSVTLRIRPHDGYVVKKVIVDGQDVGPVRRYTFSDVHCAHRVHVIFQRVHQFGWQQENGHDNGHHDRH